MKIFFVLILGLLLALSASAQTIGYKKIPSRQGVFQPFLYSKAAAPMAVAILFQGGDGNIRAAGNEDKGWAAWDWGFLSGGSKRFTDNGITVAVFEKPSDQGNLNAFRNTPEHNKDVASLIAFLRADNPNLPVWLVGTSNGSLSATSAAANLGKTGPDGIVLTASVSVPHRFGFAQKFVHPFTQAKLDDIEVPVLFVHHKYDKCEHSPYEPIPRFPSAFVKSSKVEVLTIEGGTDHSDVCFRGFHQFMGIEEQVTQQIADWIKQAKR